MKCLEIFYSLEEAVVFMASLDYSEANSELFHHVEKNDDGELEISYLVYFNPRKWGSC